MYLSEAETICELATLTISVACQDWHALPFWQLSGEIPPGGENAILTDYASPRRHPIEFTEPPRCFPLAP